MTFLTILLNIKTTRKNTSILTENDFCDKLYPIQIISEGEGLHMKKDRKKLWITLASVLIAIAAFVALVILIL